jgi:hypothetical protein
VCLCTLISSLACILWSLAIDPSENQWKLFHVVRSEDPLLGVIQLIISQVHKSSGLLMLCFLWRPGWWTGPKHTAINMEEEERKEENGERRAMSFVNVTTGL